MSEEKPLIEKNLFSRLYRKKTGRQWKKIVARKRAGILTALSAIKSRKSLGLGEITDMKWLVDWCVTTGNSIIQILPINEMHYVENSPYSALSAFAVDPVFLSLSSIKNFDTSLKVKKFLSENEERVKALSFRKRIDYSGVRELKLEVLRLLFHEDYEKKDLIAFTEKNRYWINDYAAFATLKSKFNRRPWYEWEERYRDKESKAVKQLSERYEEQLQFHIFVQWLLYRQLKELKQYAADRDVLIMGDLPILASKDSADVWGHKEYFKTNYSAGAPPDMYSADGQKWNLPPYNWKVLETNGYDWWIERLKYAENFYDMFRLDHIIGFFTIFTIHEDATTAKNGFYEPQDAGLWKEQGANLLRMIIDQTDMLVVGEDLGTVPECTRQVMEEFGIPGFKIERWERRYQDDGAFIHPKDYHPISLASLSTHDSETLRGWWLQHHEDRKQYFDALGYKGHPPSQLNEEVETRIFERIYHAASIFVILGLWDLFTLVPDALEKDPTKNRINVPGTVNEDNWTLRFNFYLEDMFDDFFAQVNQKIKQYIKESGRF